MSVDIAGIATPDMLLEPIPAALDLAPYTVADAWEIGVALRMLSDRSVAVSAYAEGMQPWLARIGPVDGEARRFVVTGAGGVPAEVSEVMLVASLDGVKLQFSCPLIGEPTEEGMREAAYPPEMVRLQRRRSARIDTPVGLPFSAHFKLAGRSFSLDVWDIGLGGVALRAAPEIARSFFVGRRIARVQLELGHDDELTTELEVRSKRVWRSYLLGEQVLLGCVFMSQTAEERALLQQMLEQLMEERRPLR